MSMGITRQPRDVLESPTDKSLLDLRNQFIKNNSNMLIQSNMSQIEIVHVKSLTNTIVSSEMDVSETNEKHQHLPLESSI